jgi:hypothetical protein
VVAAREPVGWSAIALPLGAQVFALGTQVYGYFRELPRVERLLTIAVLLIAIAQIVILASTTARHLVRAAG